MILKQNIILTIAIFQQNTSKKYTNRLKIYTNRLKIYTNKFKLSHKMKII